MKLFVFVSLLSLFASHSFGGDEKRDGGMVIACDKQGGTTYDVMDLFEAESLYDFNINLETGSDYIEIFEKMMVRLEKMNPSRARLYRDYMKRMGSEWKFVENVELGDTDDHGWQALPKGCRRLQAAVQIRRPNLAGIRVYVSKTIWDLISESGKAALLIHEFMYREGALPENDFSDSAGIRYLNAYLHSQEFSLGTLNAYHNAVTYAGFNTMDVNGIPVITHIREGGAKVLRPLVYDRYGQVTSAFANEYSFSRNGQPTRLTCGTNSADLKLTFAGPQVPAEVRASCLMIIPITERGYTGFISGDTVEFDEHGNLKSVRAPLTIEVPDVMRLEGSDFFFARSLGKRSGEFWIQFFQTGQIESFLIGMNFYDHARSFLKINGAIVKLTNSDLNTRKPILFSREGRLLGTSYFRKDPTGSFF